MRLDRDGFSIEFEVEGAEDAPLLVLVPGLGEQIGSVEFPPEQRSLLADAGFRVCVMDNRDNGLSVSSDSNVEQYSLLDMADDVSAVVRACGADRAHVVGASMGGFIARWAAIRHPDLVASLTVIMSGSGADPTDDGPQMDQDVVGRLFETLATRRDLENAIDGVVEVWRWLWANDFAFDEAWVREKVTHAHRRAYRPEGVARNLFAFGMAPGLWEAQTAIRCPTLVVHGDADPCFPLEHARAIASRIPAAKLVVRPGMGHATPSETWADLTADIVEVAS